jgi:hypothetical protein
MDAPQLNTMVNIYAELSCMFIQQFHHVMSVDMPFSLLHVPFHASKHMFCLTLPVEEGIIHVD